MEAVVMMLATACLLLGSVSCISETTRIATTTGVLIGKRSEAMKKPLLQFLGVPYAEPPLGKLRFKPPVELKDASGIERQASHFAPSCYQPQHLETVISPLLKPNQAEISEDCLYLNIYVPESEESVVKPRAVMVWLPGEGFDYADPQQFDGSYLAVEGNVVVVTVNYRLSVFGFLSTLSEDAPGNVGLLDQRMALRWVKKNIAKFQGDPENVTLFGRFTGSMSAAIHAFSPLSKEDKLFGRVILQSGVPEGDWTFERNPLNATLQLATNTGCLFLEISDVLNCLRRLPSDILLRSGMSLPQRWKPVYDFSLIYENTLKAASNWNYEPVDVMIGINNNEGTLCTIALNAMKSPFYHKILHHTLTESDFNELVATNMLSMFKTSDHLSNKLVTYEYLLQEQNAMRRELFIDFCGDLYVTSHAQKLADVLAQKESSRVYMYEFAHRPSFSIHPDFVKAGHGDDVLFTLGLPFQLPNLSEDEAGLTRRTVKAITNFARLGNPNRVQHSNKNTLWPQYNLATRQLMTFSTVKDDHEVVKRSSHEVAAVFWHDIIPEAQHKACPLAPTGAAPHSGALTQEDGAPRFLWSFISVPAAEILLFVLFCATMFLLVSTMVTVTMLLKSKKNAPFKRLR